MMIRILQISFIAFVSFISFVTIVVAIADYASSQDLKSYPGGPNMHPQERNAYHWFDTHCCNRKDCRKAEKGEVEFDGETWVHKPTGYKLRKPEIYKIPDIAQEKDRYYVWICIREHNTENGKEGTPRCLYEPDVLF